MNGDVDACQHVGHRRRATSQRHGEPRLPREASAPDSLCLVADYIVGHGKALDVPLWNEMLAAIRTPALNRRVE